eukprot:scpid45078/ scgid2452/ 
MSSGIGSDGAVKPAGLDQDDGTASLPPPGPVSLLGDLYCSGPVHSHQLYGDGLPHTTTTCSSSSRGVGGYQGANHTALSSSHDDIGYRTFQLSQQQHNIMLPGAAPAAGMHLPGDQYGVSPCPGNVPVQAYRSGREGAMQAADAAQQLYMQRPDPLQGPLVAERDFVSGRPPALTSQITPTDIEERHRHLDDKEESIKQQHQMLKKDRSDLDSLRRALHEQELALKEREASVNQLSEGLTKRDVAFKVRQEEFAAQEKEYQELVDTDFRLKKEIAMAEQHRDDLNEEAESLGTRRCDLREEITSQGWVLLELEEKKQKLCIQVDEALTGSVPARPTTAQPAHGPNSTTPPATQRSPFHGASVVGAMSHSPHSSPASKPKPPSGAGAYMASAGAGVGAQTYNYLPANLQAMYASGEQWDTMSPKARDDYIAAQLRAHQSLEEEKESELVALQLQQEEQEEATRRGALTAESLARKELEDRERLKREKNDRELRDFQMAQQLEEDERRKNRQEEEQKAKQRQEHQRREQQRQEQQRQESEQVAVRESQENALPDISLPSEPESIDAIRSRLSRIQPS